MPAGERATLNWLYGLQTRGMKFGLRNVRALLAEVGNPQDRFPSLHVAGTNGKGSTCAFLASILTEAGLRTGLYTSPHLVRFTERIRIDGREMPVRRLAEAVRRLRPLVEARRATFFEATTVAAFLYFAEEGVDLAVIETGLGGRLDATNVLRPLACGITTIGLEHTEELGATLRAIAREKAGIMKRGTPCITGAYQPEVLRVLRQEALRRGAPLHRADRLVRMEDLGSSGGSARVRYTTRSLELSAVTLGLAGPHQRSNARLALGMLEAARRRGGGGGLLARVDPPAARRGLARVARTTGLKARLQRLDGVLLDAAHNPDGVRTLVAALEAEGKRNLMVVFGVMKDKDAGAMLDALAPLAACMVAVEARVARSLPSRLLLDAMRRRGIPAVRGGTVAAGLRRARAMAGPRVVLVTGSHYVAGEAIEALGPEGP
jgi:dihydrofolate synthase/folylpolyglutamate synthase